MNLIKKVSIVLLCIIAFSFCMPKGVRAEDGIGGKLLEPVVSLVVSLGDGINNIIHKALVSQPETLISVDMADGVLRVILTVLVGIVAAAAAIALVVLTAGAASAVLGPILAGIGVSIGSLSAGAILTAGLIGGGVGAVYFYNSDFFPETLYFPIYTVTADKIFGNEIPVFDVDFFNPQGEEITLNDGTKSWGKIVTLPDGTEIPVESTAYKMQSTIAKWYTKLRDISVVALLSILVYIGIRMLLSSTSNDKAKYKQMILDWVTALCLLFVMQYIMSFANIMVRNIINLVKVSNDDQYTVIAVQYDEKIIESLANYMAGPDASDEDKENMKKKLEEGENSIVKTMGSGDKVILWDVDSMGRARWETQMAKAGNTNFAGYTVCYIILVFFTVFFVFTYLKRVIYMAFLTLVAPLVALTYPIDKINDGKAQAFNMWIKEYIFNLMIQPLHLLLYTILVTSAYELIAENIVYAIVALGFMIPAEKLMRKFFGFEKAQTPGLLAGPAGATMMMAGMNKLLSKGPKTGKRDGSGKNGDSNDEKDNTKFRTKDDFDPDEINSHQIGTNAISDEKETSVNMINEDATNYNQLGKNNSMDSQENNAFELEGINTQLGNSDEEKNESMKINNKNDDDGNNVQTDSKPERNLKKAIKRSARFYGQGMAKKMANGVKNAHLGRKAIRMAGGAALGTVTGAMGLAAGVASGDPSKAAQYAGASALGGYKLGSGTVNKAVNELDVPGTAEQFKENYYGKKAYKEKQLQQFIKQKQNDLELKWKLEDKLKSKDAANKYMKNDLPKVLRFGDFDNKTIVAMAQMESEGVSQNETIAAALISERDLSNKDSNSLGDKAATEFEKTIKRKGKERGLDGENLEKFVNKSIGNVKKLDEYRYK